MKKIIYLYIVLMIISACDLLDITPTDRISAESVWGDEKLIELYVSTCYHAVEHGFYLQIWGCGISGETNPSGGQSQVLQGILTADNITSVDADDAYTPVGNPPRLDYWSTAYSYIRDINVFFENINDAAISDDAKDEFTGEMKFIRAFVYSNLIWRYGGVPIIDYVFELNDDFYSGVTRDSYDDCVDFICSDLDDAIDLLPNQQTGEDLGKTSADAARALKSRVLLYAASPLNNPGNDLSKWQDAADAAAELLNSGYSLYYDYKNLFLEEGNNEIIFARYFTNSNYQLLHATCNRNGDNGAAGSANAPTQNMVNAYQMTNGELPYLDEENQIINPASGYDPQNPYLNRDPRFYASILYDGSIWLGRETETYDGGMDSPDGPNAPWNASLTGYYLKKIVDPNVEPEPISGAFNKSTNPYIFFRYAEILLNYAEAQFELGNEATAREYVNMVRSRTGVEMPDITASGDELREKIQQERRVELAFEGHRYFDVRRWKIAMETEQINVFGIQITLNEDGSKSYNWNTILERNFYEKNYLIPIPQKEINKSSGALEQNSGY